MNIRRKAGFLLITVVILYSSCKKQRVSFSDTTEISAIQIQKLDTATRSGSGTIYLGHYSSNKDTIYFDVTYYPDEQPPTYDNWQVRASLPPGVKITPSLTGTKDFSEPINISVTAPDGQTTTSAVLKARIYEVPFQELDKGFGRYRKLFERTQEQLGGWSDNSQTALAVVGDYLIVNNAGGPFLVYDKLTGKKADKVIPKPEGVVFSSLFVDDQGVLLANDFVSFSPGAGTVLKVYRWSNGIDQVPEVFYQLHTDKIPVNENAGMGIGTSIRGDTHGTAQIFLTLDGRGSNMAKAVRISILNGQADDDIDVFNTPVGATWGGTTLAMSDHKRLPYVNTYFGFPPNIAFVDTTGTTHSFIVDPNKSNFLNKIIGNACYFEFNHARYVALSSISWPGNFRLLIFNLDDTSLVSTLTNADPNTYSIFNPLSADAQFLSAGDSGDLAVQVQDDGKSALVYVLGVNAGIFAYRITDIAK